jgi:hypothetical protein
MASACSAMVAASAGSTEPARPTFLLIQVVKAGDFESVLSFGVGVAQKAPFHMYAQPKLGRVILDIRARTGPSQ